MSLTFFNSDFRERCSDLVGVTTLHQWHRTLLHPVASSLKVRGTQTNPWSDRFKPVKIALVATAVGLNISLAAMITVVASAFGLAGWTVDLGLLVDPRLSTHDGHHTQPMPRSGTFDLCF
jgi:hypothetical protein